MPQIRASAFEQNIAKAGKGRAGVPYNKAQLIDVDTGRAGVHLMSLRKKRIVKRFITLGNF